MTERTDFKINPACGLILLQSILFGIGDPVSKVAYEEMSVYTLLTIRFCFTLLLLMLLFGGRIMRQVRSVSPSVWLLPSLCNAVAYVLINFAFDATAATSAAFLRSLSTVFTPLLAFVVYRTKLRRIHVPILVAIVLGSYLMCGVGGLNGFGIGEIAALLAALFLAATLVFSGESLKEMDAISLTAVQVSVAAIVSIVCAFALEGGIHASGASFATWAVIAYLAVVCTLIGYFLQNKALEGISSRTVALLQCSAPVFTAVCSFFILGERLNTYGMIGAGILLACVVAETMIE